MQLAWGAATDRGRVRRRNEDSHLAEPPVFLVADGMGGRAAGQVASAIVVDEFRTRIGSPAVETAWVTQCVARAGARIREGFGGGATVSGAAVVTHSGRPYWLAFNVGDSRIYRRTGGHLAQVSVDHSYVQSLVDAGRLEPAAARLHPRRNEITRAVGVAGDQQPDCWLIPATEGDRLLMCSDGVTTELADEDLERIMAASLDPQLAAEALVLAAVRAGGHDNATAVVVDVLAVAADGVPGVDNAPTRPRPAVPSGVDDAPTTPGAGGAPTRPRPVAAGAFVPPPRALPVRY